MAQEARLYNYLWHAGPTPRARKVAAVIRRALKDIERFPLAYKRLEATNGHGTVDEFIQFLKEVEHECRANPNKRLYSFG